MSANESHSHDQLVYNGSKESISNVYAGSLLASNIAVDDPFTYASTPFYEGTTTNKYIKDTSIAHTHSVTAKGYLYGSTDSDGGTESRPNNFTVRVWKRIS